MAEQEKSKQQHFEIPIEGALGLLALGAVGVRAWKEKKEQHLQFLNNSSEDVANPKDHNITTENKSGDEQNQARK